MSDVIRKVLLVGGGGYLGVVLSRLLLDGGYAVRSLDAEWFGDARADLQVFPQFERITLDTRHLEQVADAVRGCDAVIHLSGIVGDPACAIDDTFTFSCNYLSTVALAKICKRIGIRRFIFASSCSVYGHASHEMVDEQSEPNPLSHYAIDKLACEHDLLQMADTDFSPTLLRLSTLFGWSPRMRFDLVVNLLTAQAYEGSRLQIHGGTQWRPFVHVSDAANAFMRTLEADLGLVHGEVFNVGASSHNHRIIDVAHDVRELMPGTTIDVVAQTIDERDYSVSFDKIARELGFEAKVGLKGGILEIVSELERLGPVDLRQACFNNVVRTREIVAGAVRGSVSAFAG